MASATSPELRVGVEEARGLLAADLNGFSDPYVVVQLLDHKGTVLPGASAIFKTAIRTKTLSPEWHDSVLLGGDQGNDLRVVTTVRFLVMDFDGFKRDDTLGVVDIPVEMALQLAETSSDLWFQVTKLEPQMSKDATGELRLTFASGDHQEEKLVTDTVEDDGSPNLLYVTIDSGRDLLPMDRNNSSDPLVKLALSGQRFSTTTIEKTLKPHWDERFAFVLRDPMTTLDLLVEDEDRTVNDFLGRSQVVLADVLKTPNEEVKLSLKLLDKKLQADKDRGTLQARLLWVYDANAESIATSMKKKKKQQQSIFHQFTSHLRITAPDAQHDETDDQLLLARLNEIDADLDAESDDEDALPLPPGAKKIRFAAITIHRAEELPPLDALHFEKDKHKPSAPGGGIDAYVAAWISDRPEEFIRTRIHTRKGRRDELSTSFHETLLLKIEPTKTNIKLAVMDWDGIGGDETVSHVELRDVEAVAAAKGGKPFWWNLYGAPLVNATNKDAVDKLNEDSDAGSTYRGRIVLTVKIVEKPSTRYDETHQKRAAAKLPQELFPPSRVYRLRAHFLSAIGLPSPTSKYYVSLSCGMHEITSTQKTSINRMVEWNETEESDRLLFPSDVNQIPDVILSLCTGEWERRVVVSYKRFSVSELIQREFKDTTVEWVSLVDDPTTEVVKKNEFPGKVLLCMGFGPIESASMQVWDQKAMLGVVNQRAPYQVRVRVHGLKDVLKQDGTVVARATPLNVRVQCADKEVVAGKLILEQHSTPAVFSLDVNLPQLQYASQVLVHFKDDSNDRSNGAFIGTLAVSLQETKDASGVDASAIVTRCTAQQLKTDTRPQLPQPKWVRLLALDEAIDSTQALASVEIIRKTFPDEQLPVPEASIATATP